MMKKDENGGALLESSSSDSSPSRSSLYDLADLMAHLPIKGRPRMGLSKHYNGKSQSFVCVGSVRSVEDLAKRERYSKCCKTLSPMPAIAKRSPKGSLRLQCNASYFNKPYFTL